MDIGETLPFRSDLYDRPVEQGGVLVNAPTVSLTIALPDGTTVTPTVTNPPATTGKYLYDYTPTLPGRHVGTWLFTLANGVTSSYVETFDVGTSLVTVDEAVAHLRAAGVVTSFNDLEQLQWLCFVATDAVERDLGRVLTRRTVVEVHDASAVIILRSTPVVSVTSVVASGAAVLAADYALDQSSGILYRAYGSFGYGRQSVAVTYVAGYTDPPRIVRKVALNTVQAMYQQSQQASHPLLDEGEVESFSAASLSMLSPIEQRAYESLRAVGVA